MEELDLQGLLEHFKSGGFLRGEQVILGHFGTVQTVLSLIFETPVKVKLVSQIEIEGAIQRSASLCAGDRQVCYAESHIPVQGNRREVLVEVLSGALGLGQVIMHLNIPTKRNLVEVGRSKDDFWRFYHIDGPGLHFEIREVFPRQPFLDVGWFDPREVEFKPNLNYYKSQGGKEHERISESSGEEATKGQAEAEGEPGAAQSAPGEVQKAIDIRRLRAKTRVTGLLLQRSSDVPTEAAGQEWKKAILEQMRGKEPVPGAPFMTVTMPCGQVLKYEQFEDIPDHDVPCPCGDPNHCAVRYSVIEVEKK